MIGQELLDIVLPENGLLCIVGLMSDRSAPPVVRYFNMGSEEADECIRSLDEAGREVYFGCASYVDSSKAKDVRNVHSLKAFYLDLDCGKDKSYPDQKEAIIALTSFCKEVGLPIPTLVDSGFGVHAYWPLEESVDYNTWKPVADALKRKTIEKGLKADNVVTADGARILRIPGTVNKKRNNAHKLVKLKKVSGAISLEDFASKIGYIARGSYSATNADPVMDALLKNSTKYKFSRIYKKSIDIVEVTEQVEEEYLQEDGKKAIRLVNKKVQKSAGCPQIAYCVANRATLEEPMWDAALSIAWHCIDKNEAIDMVSRDYPDYVFAEAYAKAERKVGPRLCEKWKELDQPQLCGQCIHRGKISTPLLLGVMIEEATPEDNVFEDKHESLGETVTVEIPSEYPFPWLRPKTGGVAFRGSPDDAAPSGDPDSDPDEVMVYEHDLWVKSRMCDGQEEHIVLARRLPNDGIAEFTAPLTIVFKTEKLQELLAKKGISAAANPKRLELLRKYIAAWVHKLQKDSAAERSRTQFGWHDNGQSFVIGTREIDRTGQIKFCPIAKNVENVAKIYSKQGELAMWQKVANTYALPGNEARGFSLFASFGAPLYKFIGEGSMVLHLTNVASGVGKSTAQKVATSVWGNPVEGMLTDNDTNNAKLHRAGVLNNIPVCIDELTNMLPEAVSRLAFDLSSGRGRNRMASNANEERINETTWATIFQTSGNNSLHDVLRQHKSSVEGEMYRILEIPVPMDNSLTKQEADDLFSYTLPRHYGMAGEEFMKYVVPNLDNAIERMKEIHDKFDKEAGLKSKDRFYSACFAAAFTGAEIANRLGIINIPIQPIWQWALDLVTATRATIRKASIVSEENRYEEIISRYWNEKHQHILVVSAGATETDEALLMQSTFKPVIGSLKGRFEVSKEKLYLTIADFESWMSEKRLPTTQLVKALKANNALETEQMLNLGFDTKMYSTAPVMVYRFNTKLLGVIP
jgi:hypothetical protein